MTASMSTYGNDEAELQDGFRSEESHWPGVSGFPPAASQVGYQSQTDRPVSRHSSPSLCQPAVRPGGRTDVRVNVCASWVGPGQWVRGGALDCGTLRLFQHISSFRICMPDVEWGTEAKILPLTPRRNCNTAFDRQNIRHGLMITWRNQHTDTKTFHTDKAWALFWDLFQEQTIKGDFIFIIFVQDWRWTASRKIRS